MIPDADTGWIYTMLGACMLVGGFKLKPDVRTPAWSDRWHRALLAASFTRNPPLLVSSRVASDRLLAVPAGAGGGGQWGGGGQLVHGQFRLRSRSSTVPRQRHGAELDVAAGVSSQLVSPQQQQLVSPQSTSNLPLFAMSGAFSDRLLAITAHRSTPARAEL